MTEDGLIYALHLPMHCVGRSAHSSEPSVPSGEDTLPGAESQTGAWQVKASHSTHPL